MAEKPNKPGIPEPQADAKAPQTYRRATPQRTAAGQANVDKAPEKTTTSADGKKPEVTGQVYRRAITQAAKARGAKAAENDSTQELDSNSPKTAAEVWSQGKKKTDTARLSAADLRGATGRIRLDKTARMKALGPQKGDATMLAFRPQKVSRNPLVRVVGNLLYDLGYAGEYRLTQIWRVVRDAAAFTGQILVWLLGAFFGWLWGLIRNLGRDIAAPFVHFRRRQRQVRRVRERAQARAELQKTEATPRFLGVRMKNSMRFVVNVAGILLPVAAAAALIFTVHNILSMDYGLAVEVNGQVLGYVADQNVVEGAKGLLRDRIQLAANQELSDWQLNPSYSIARTDEFITTQQLANQILRNAANPNDIVEATGLVINDELYAVTDRGAELKTFLDAMLAEYAADAPEDAAISFVQTVECNPESLDVFYASSVVDYNELIRELSRNVSPEVAVVADGETTLEEIAQANDLALEVLFRRNPALAGQEADYMPEAGTSVLIRRAQPFLQVQTTFRRMVTEPIPYSVEEVETEEHALGVSRVVQQGADGERQVWEDHIYIDGELDSIQRLEELTVILSEPVSEIVEVGTYNFDEMMVEGGYQSAYLWPVPSSTWSSRGISSYHRGQDINAAMGEPIFACNAGVVITAGWHYSYGYHVVIEHPDGIQTLYAHCSSLAVQEGDIVQQRQYIGAIGSTGRSSGPHCHLEFLVNGSPVNPLNFVAPPEGYSFGHP